MHSALKNINKALNIIVTKPDTPLDTLNKHISKAAIQANLTIPNISQDEYNNSYDSTTNTLKEYKNIIWQARNTEKRNEQNEKIKFYNNRRYSDFKDNTTRMIDSILQRHTDQVNYEKIILNNEILTEPKDIKEATQQHFKNWTRENKTNKDHWHQWEYYYKPLSHIQPQIFDNLLTPIKIEDLLQTIAIAPKNKATGPLGISNEILQHLPPVAISYLLDIMNACLLLQTTPNQWADSNIWPISKKPQYNYDLNTTRLITLIEHTRKIFTKILTNRLIPIITRNEILSPQNFAAFPHQSTLQPVSQLTNIIEHSTTEKKEIWILLQDMSKAFDSVHLPTLYKALERIRIPKNFVKLLTSLLSNRRNRVITTLGLTKYYYVEDGIDQGETFFPLLWKIYYDPLISRIHKEFLGFQEYLSIQQQHKTIYSSIMAYMDDSLWTAPDKKTLTDILQVANSFYKLNNICVNSSKSILVTNSETPDKTITFANDTIIAIEKRTPFKYLDM